MVLLLSAQLRVRVIVGSSAREWLGPYTFSLDDSGLLFYTPAPSGGDEAGEEEKQQPLVWGSIFGMECSEVVDFDEDGDASRDQDPQHVAILSSFLLEDSSGLRGAWQFCGDSKTQLSRMVELIHDFLEQGQAPVSYLAPSSPPASVRHEEEGERKREAILSAFARVRAVLAEADPDQEGDLDQEDQEERREEASLSSAVAALVHAVEGSDEADASPRAEDGRYVWNSDGEHQPVTSSSFVVFLSIPPGGKLKSGPLPLR